MLTLNESNDPYVHLSDSDLCLQLASDYPDLIAFLCAKIDPQNRSAYPNFAAQPSCTFFVWLMINVVVTFVSCCVAACCLTIL